MSRIVTVLLIYYNTNLQIVVRFEVFTAVTMKNSVFWDVTPCGSFKNKRFGGDTFLRNEGSNKSHKALTS
jgi:hypothetical protein